MLPLNYHCSTTQSQSKSDTKKENSTDVEKDSNAYHGSNGLSFMPVRESLVGKMKVSVLRDSGCKVSKGAKIRNRYNQVPHLTQDTNGKVTNSQ